jgi:hypothetical protein
MFTATVLVWAFVAVLVVGNALAISAVISSLQYSYKGWLRLYRCGQVLIAVCFFTAVVLCALGVIGLDSLESINSQVLMVGTEVAFVIGVLDLWAGLTFAFMGFV